jgi:DNA repair exonuclease SbcCD ATPase subunit
MTSAGVLREYSARVHDIAQSGYNRSSILENFEAKVAEVLKYKEKACALKCQLRIAENENRLRVAEFAFQKSEMENELKYLRDSERRLRELLSSDSELSSQSFKRYDVCVTLEKERAEAVSQRQRAEKWKNRAKELEASLQEKQKKAHRETNQTDNNTKSREGGSPDRSELSGHQRIRKSRTREEIDKVGGQSPDEKRKDGHGSVPLFGEKLSHSDLQKGKKVAFRAVGLPDNDCDSFTAKVQEVTGDTSLSGETLSHLREKLDNAAHFDDLDQKLVAKVLRHWFKVTKGCRSDLRILIFACILALRVKKILRKFHENFNSFSGSENDENGFYSVGDVSDAENHQILRLRKRLAKEKSMRHSLKDRLRKVAEFYEMTSRKTEQYRQKYEKVRSELAGTSGLLNQRTGDLLALERLVQRQAFSHSICMQNLGQLTVQNRYLSERVRAPAGVRSIDAKEEAPSLCRYVNPSFLRGSCS